MQLLGSSERILLVVVIDAMMTGSSYSRKFLGFFFWLGIGELCILELIKSWTTKYHCKYINSIGISKTSLFMTWSKSFKDLLFQDAIESCIKSKHCEDRLSVIVYHLSLGKMKLLPRQFIDIMIPYSPYSWERPSQWWKYNTNKAVVCSGIFIT